MQLIPSLELNRRTASGDHRASSTAAETDRLVELSSWMMVLATIRLVCAAADYTSSFLEFSRGASPTLRILNTFIQENQPFFVLGLIWPLALAIALRKTRWPELLRASAATFLVLAICGALESAAMWTHTRTMMLSVGSFHVPRRALTSPYLSEVILGLLGITQLLVELGVGVWCVVVANHYRRSGPAEPNKQLSARQARIGRLAVCVSLAFFVVVIRSSVWSAYLEIVNQSAFVREFVLRNDSSRIHARSNRGRNLPETAQDRQVRHMQALFDAGMEAWGEDRFAAARESYEQLAAQIDSIPPERWSNSFRVLVSTAFNNLAWLMATCPDASIRDSQGAVNYAKRAVDVAPMERNFWNTLGVAYYRAGQLEEAKNALYRSMEMRNEGDSFDWFFLAAIHFKLGHKDRAQQWYVRAAASLREIGESAAGSALDQLDELYRFEVEVAQVIGLKKPGPPISTIRDAMCWTGAEAVGIPIPATSSAALRFARARSPASFGSLFRLHRRAGPLLPASTRRQGR
jgi:hypothetical protein